MNFSINNQSKARFRFSALACSLTLGLASCSLTNPYVDETKVVENKSELCSSTAANMANALKCSTAIKSRYIELMGDQANLNAWTGIGLIPLTAYTVGFAANGESATKISDFALTSAGLYSLSSWLSAPDRTKIYGVGQKAVVCAEQAIQAFILSLDSQVRYDKMIVGFDTLNEDYANARTVLAAYSSVPEHNTSIVASVQSELSETTRLRQAAGSIISQYSRAPGELLSTVKNINATVNEALSGTVQSLSVLPSFLSGLGDLYEQNKAEFTSFAPTPVTAGDAEKSLFVGDDDEQAFAERVSGIEDSLLDFLAALSTANADMALLVSALTPPQPAKSLEQCGIDTESIKAALSVNPVTLTFTLGQGLQNSISVGGGNGTYTYVADASVFTVSQTPAFGDSLTIGLVDGAKPGSYIIKVKDTTGRYHDVSVTVNAAASVEEEDDDDEEGDS